MKSMVPPSTRPWLQVDRRVRLNLIELSRGSPSFRRGTSNLQLGQIMMKLAVLLCSASAFVSKAPLAPSVLRAEPASVRMNVVTPGNFKNGLTIEYQDSVFKVRDANSCQQSRRHFVPV